MAMSSNQFWDADRFEELKDVLLESKDFLRLSSTHLKDPILVGNSIALFVKKSKRILYYGVSSLLALVLIHYAFLRYANGDIMWLFGFWGIVGLAGFMVPIWLGAKIIKTRKLLRILNKSWRNRLVAGAVISTLLPIMPVYVLGSEYIRTLSYQSGTCLQLTGADDDYYYVTNISCYSPKALQRIVIKVDDKKTCDNKELTSFASSYGLFCTEQIRVASPEEREIMGGREISDENLV